jgi:hypothetical protein
MNKKELKSYYYKHCRFRLKSGKDVYGIVWEEEKNGESTLHFSSAAEAAKLLQTNVLDVFHLQSDFIINPDDIVGAELIQDDEEE